MIAVWISEAEQVIREVIGSTGSNTEYNVLLGLAVLGFLFALFNISAAMGSTMTTPLRVFAVTVVGGYLVLTAVVAMRLYLVPVLRSSPMLPWLPLIVALLATILIVAPLAKWILASGYFEAVFALVLSAAAAALVVVMVRAGFNAFRHGDKGFDKTQRRRDSINRVIDGNY